MRLLFSLFSEAPPPQGVPRTVSRASAAGHPLLSARVSRGGVGDHEGPRTGHLREGTCPSPPHTQAWAREEHGKQLLDFVTFVVVTKSFLTHSARTGLEHSSDPGSPQRMLARCVMFFSAKSVKSGVGLELQEHGHGRQGPPRQAMAAWCGTGQPFRSPEVRRPRVPHSSAGSPGKAMSSGRARPSLGAVGP